MQSRAHSPHHPGSSPDMEPIIDRQEEQRTLVARARQWLVRLQERFRGDSSPAEAVDEAIGEMVDDANDIRHPPSESPTADETTVRITGGEEILATHSRAPYTAKALARSSDGQLQPAVAAVAAIDGEPAAGMVLEAIAEARKHSNFDQGTSHGANTPVEDEWSDWGEVDSTPAARWRRVAETDPAFRYHLERSLARSSEESPIYGARVLAYLDALAKGQNDPNREASVQAFLAHRQERLGEACRESRAVRYIVADEWQKLGLLTPDIDPVSFPMDERLGQVSTKDFEVYLRRRQERLEANEHALRVEIVRAVEGYRSLMAGLINDGSAFIDHATLDRRLGDVTVKLSDPLTEEWSSGSVKTDSVHAVYNEKQRQISVCRTLDINPDNIVRTVWHELNHAVSARILRLSSAGGHDTLRIGLQTLGKYDRFEWLDEAVTESYTSNLVDPSEHYQDVAARVKSYEKHQTLLSLLERKVPRVLFLQAYFENTGPAEPGSSAHDSQPGTAWGRLQQSIQEAYGRPGLLLALDKLINGDKRRGLPAQGVDAAIAYVRDLEQASGSQADLRLAA